MRDAIRPDVHARFLVLLAREMRERARAAGNPDDAA